MIALVVPLPGAAQSVLKVSPKGPLRSIGAALDRAESGDTIRVASGIYVESLVIERPVTLLGDGDPIIDGGGVGHVIEALAPLTIRGFTIRNSGLRVDTEDAGIMVRGATATIDQNEFEDVFYGIYLKESPRSRVTHNRIVGRPLPLPRRGDGIRLWQSPGSLVEANHVRQSRDVVIYFSDSLTVTDNVIIESRYGLHYMYSDHNLIAGNRFEGNEVAAFLMYSTDVRIEDNVLLDSHGATGIGLGLKDADAIRVTGNVIASNVVGIHLDNSPSDPAAPNHFGENLVALNAIGVRLLPSVRGNRFEDNDFVWNDRPAEAAGGVRDGFAGQNRFHGNHWSAYAGFDSDDDGVGDTPFVRARLADEILARNPQLAAFTGSPALDLLDALTRFFPLLAPVPVVVDSAPRIEAGASHAIAFTGPRAARAAVTGRPGGGVHAGAWILLSGLAVGLVTVVRTRGSRWNRRVLS
jgi:nitrous oxidase accessory protein